MNGMRVKISLKRLKMATNPILITGSACVSRAVFGDSPNTSSPGSTVKDSLRHEAKMLFVSSHPSKADSSRQPVRRSSVCRSEGGSRYGDGGSSEMKI
jgi:hypothetical protein